MINILFTNAGRRTYLIEYALDLFDEGYDINIFVSDTSDVTASFWVDERVNRIVTPKVSDSEDLYIEKLLEICIEQNVNIVIPLMDFEIPVLSKNKKDFKLHGIEIITSDYELVTSLLNKKGTETLCKKLGINYPQSWYSLDDFNYNFPVILKRINGSGSVGLKIIESEKDLNDFVEGRDLLQEYITGKEYGVDIFNDLNGNYLHSCVKEKLLMRAGETDKARVLSTKKYEDIIKDISSKLKHVGNLDADFIKTKDGSIYFIDFNPRFGGGYPFSHLAGCNYLKAIIDLFIKKEANFPECPKNIIGMKGIGLFKVRY